MLNVFVRIPTDNALWHSVGFLLKKDVNFEMHVFILCGHVLFPQDLMHFVPMY